MNLRIHVDVTKQVLPLTLSLAW